MYMTYRQNPQIGEDCERRFSTNGFPNYIVINIVVLLFYFFLLLQFKGEFFSQNAPVDDNSFRSRNVALLYVD